MDFTHDGFIYFNEFENAINKFLNSKIEIIAEEDEDEDGDPNVSVNQLLL